MVSLKLPKLIDQSIYLQLSHEETILPAHAFHAFSDIATEFGIFLTEGN